MRREQDRGADQDGTAQDAVVVPLAFGRLTRRQLTALVSIAVFATAMRLYGLGARPLFWEDEIALWEYILTGSDYYMPQEAPLYGWLQFGWMWWSQQPTTNTMRLLSIALGVLGVLAAFVLGRLLGGVRMGLLLATLLSVSPMALALAHEVRPYTLFILASVLLLWCFLSAWERNTPRWWLAYGLALTTALFTHLLSAQLCVALGITAVAGLALERRRPRILARFLAFSATSVAFGLLGIAWLRSRPDQTLILTGPYGRGPLDFVQGSITSLGGAVETQLPAALATASLALLGLVVLARRRALHAILLASVILAGGLLNYATMEQMTWPWLSWQRYLTHLLVPYLVLVAFGATWLAHAVTRRLSGLPASALAGAVTLVPFLLALPGILQWIEKPARHPKIEVVPQYSTFACQNQHRVLGMMFTEFYVKAAGLSKSFPRQVYAYDQVRHDSLASYSVGQWGVRRIVKRAGRGKIANALEYVPMSSPPPDGPYLVFPPVLGCRRLAQPPVQGVKSSVRVLRHRDGLICHIRFKR